MPNSPSSFICSTIASGTRRRARVSATGITSRSTNRGRWRRSRCSVEPTAEAKSIVARHFFPPWPCRSASASSSSTMEPVPQMVELGRRSTAPASTSSGSARRIRGGASTRWRRARSTSLSALIAAATERVALGWRIISPYTRHPLEIAMEARVLQEVAGPGPVPARLGPFEDLHAGGGRGRRQAGAAADGRCARPSRSSASALDGEGFDLRGQGVRGRGVRCSTRRAGVAARRRTDLRRRHRAEDPEDFGRDRRRAAHRQHHDAGIRPLTPARTWRRAHGTQARDAEQPRPRQRHRRLDRRGPRPRPGRGARDRGHVPREQGPEHHERGRRPAREGGHRPGGDPAGR